MALVQFGGGVTDIRGSIAGNTFAKALGGNYVRVRRKGVNPGSSLQGIRRAQHARLAEYWSGTLTAAQRTAWSDYAAGTTWTNRLGQTINIPGISAFIRTNALLLAMDEAIQAAGPTVMGHGGGITLSMTAESADQKINVAEPGGAFDKDTDADFVAFFQGVPQNAGRAMRPKLFQYIGKVEGDGVTPPTFPLELDSAFYLNDDQVTWLRGVRIDPYGRVATAAYYSATIETGS